MKTPKIRSTNISRRDALKYAAAVPLLPSAMFYNNAHAFWPVFFRLLLGGAGRSAVRGAASRQIARSTARSVAKKATKTASKRAGKAALVSGGGLATFAGSTIAAEVGLQLLLNSGDNDSIILPETRWEDFDSREYSLESWDGNESKSIILDVPPINRDINDVLAWAAHDVLTGELTKLGEGPLLVQANEDGANLELPIGIVKKRGPHRFIAVFQHYGNQIPIVGTSVVEIV